MNREEKIVFELLKFSFIRSSYLFQQKCSSSLLNNYVYLFIYFKLVKEDDLNAKPEIDMQSTNTACSSGNHH